MAALEPDIRSVSPGHPVNVNSLDEVVLIHVIAHSPYKASSYCLRSRFGPKFDCPLSLLVIFDVNLFLCALGVSANVGEFSS